MPAFCAKWKWQRVGETFLIVGVSRLAVSTPVDSVWVHPRRIIAVFREDIEPLAEGAQALDADEIERRLNQRSSGREFVWLQAAVYIPDVAAEIESLDLPGVLSSKGIQTVLPNR